MAHFLTALVALVVLVPDSLGQGPPPPPMSMPPMPSHAMMYPQVQSSHCRYLITAPSNWGVNASPFKIYTRSYSGLVRRSYPIEVSILPSHPRLGGFNFTDFALWAEPDLPPFPAAPRIELEPVAGAQQAPPVATTQLGTWHVLPRFAPGTSSMKCNMYTASDDTVGSFEERMTDLLKRQFPHEPRLVSFQAASRSGAAFLWYPDDKALAQSTIKFVAKLKSMGGWFHLESTAWNVYKPPPPPQPFNLDTFVEQVSSQHGTPP
ncbi:uncharacterized protein LOC112557240 isoform X3 [Pomacea canaliculata]|uniref:uncharacterized protein LOC112557240 isoform X3 n=1 Tax=Pomacea canaliculata TaxID=400727 RepID=UPI000D73D822|nr:uncharacterized protein LOC112557240 isoform X3 [Pomacea canaliculata]